MNVTTQKTPEEIGAQLARYKPEPETSRFRLPGREHLDIPAAVLFCIFSMPSGPRLLLTRRNESLRDHPGQVALPGGKLHSGESAESGALREAAEETGLNPDLPRVLGRLPTYEVATGYKIVPVVAWVDGQPTLSPDYGEVAEVFDVPLATVANLSAYTLHARDVVPGQRRAEFYRLSHPHHEIWGATAYICRQFALAVQEL